MTLTNKRYTGYYIFSVIDSISGISNESILLIKRYNTTLNINLLIIIISILILFAKYIMQ